MTDPNLPELQAAFVVGLAQCGLPSPASPCVVQIQWQGSDLVARSRWTALRRQTKVTFLTPTAESRYENADVVSGEALRRWCIEVAAPDALACVYLEMRKRGFPWPREWPRLAPDQIGLLNAG
jgi:hypothetical protein